MFLGIEIGGTKLQFGLGMGDGKFIGFKRLAVEPGLGAEGIRGQMSAIVPEFLSSHAITSLDGIGVGFGGPIDEATRRILKSHQIEGWADFPVAEWLEEHFAAPVALGNDADVAGLAEALFGAGKGLSPIFYVTVGSGIGGALIINQQIYRGMGRGAGEIGHLWVDYDADQPNFQPKPPTWNIVEHRASGWAIAQAAGAPSGEAVAAAARAGDAHALQVLSRARRRLVMALSHVLALFCPRRIVIGGGVSLLGEELLFKPLREELAAIAFRPFADCYDVMSAALGEGVVVHGALALAAAKINSLSKVR